MAVNKRYSGVSGVRAEYRDTGLDCYKGNPFIEALPPIYSERRSARLLQYAPGYSESYRQLPLEYRLHLILDAVRFIQPIQMHLRIEECFSRMIRSGYVGRNPLSPKFQAQYHQWMKALTDELVELPPPGVTSRGCSIVGHSGVGKSTAIGRVLDMYPQVIFHGRYNRRPFTHSQLVYVKLECPYDGLLSGLCKSFFLEVEPIARY